MGAVELMVANEYKVELNVERATRNAMVTRRRKMFAYNPATWRRPLQKAKALDGPKISPLPRLRLGWTMSQPPAEPVDPRTTNRARFELELEFVQSLANPYYLHSLAQQGILSQPAFINFLKYLLYWKEKDYARFIL